MKRTRTKRLAFENSRMWWGAYAGCLVQDVPAKYMLQTYRDGWAIGDLLVWIETNLSTLEQRKKQEKKNGYAKRFKRKYYYNPQAIKKHNDRKTDSNRADS